MASKKTYLTRLIFIPALLYLLFFEWVMNESSILGRCEPGDFIAIMFNFARYLSMFSIIVTIVLIIIFLKKSEKFFGILIAVSCVFVIVIPFMLIFFGGENTCKTGEMWEAVSCIERDKKW